MERLYNEELGIEIFVVDYDDYICKPKLLTFEQKEILRKFTAMINNEGLQLDLDAESITIYRDNGENSDPTIICYWHFEEWEEDPTIVPSILNAINLFYTNQKELLRRLGFDDLIL
jgi:hypothetical protein